MSIQFPLNHLRLLNGRPETQARVAMVSLPLPRQEIQAAALGELPTQIQPIGWWPESQIGRRGVVRRQLMLAVSDAPVPAELGIGSAANISAFGDPPEAACEVVHKLNTGIMLSEVDEVEFSFAGRTFGLRMGLRHAGENKWWEWVRVEELWSGPLCRAVRMAGFIEVDHFGDEIHDSIEHQKQSKGVHFHNWLRGDVYALMFANGVVQLTCRHVNNHLFDHGRDLEDVVPIIGLRCPEANPVDETLDGSRTRFECGDLTLNLEDAASLVGPAHPGLLRTEADLVVYQPYEGVEIRGDAHRRIRDDGYIVSADEKRVPKGVAKSVRFGISMGDAPPDIARFTIPDWWYAECGEFWPDGALPVRDDMDAALESLQSSVKDSAAQRLRCFDNAVLTGVVWEGEIPYSQMMYYYRSGDPDYFDYALNDAYHIADIGFDHATETMRMHHFPFGAVSPALYRTLSMTFGYLETGDPYLLHCSESAATRFYQIDTHNWPRRSYGRDAASVRSLIFLWDYTGKEDYLTMARECLGRLMACQHPDGSYSDQGGAVGACGGACNEIIKVWMAMLANEAMVDYLQRVPHDEEILAAVRRTGEFLLSAQIERDGRYTWAYCYAYGDNLGDPIAMRKTPDDWQPYPDRARPGAEEFRFLTFLAERTGDPRFLEALQRTWDTAWKDAPQQEAKVGYTSNKVVQHIPYAQAHLWRARLEAGGGVRIAPLLTDRHPAIRGTISTPLGMLEVECRRDEEGVHVETRSDADFDVVVELPDRSEPLRISSNAVRTASR